MACRGGGYATIVSQGLPVKQRNGPGTRPSRLRRAPAVILGKATAVASRALRLGGGTTMPGRVARAVAPDIARQLAARLPQGCVVVTGTNGKTTTSRLIHHILRLAGLRPVHNRAGPNLAAGIVTALGQDTAWGRRPPGATVIDAVSRTNTRSCTLGTWATTGVRSAAHTVRSR